MDYFYEDEAVHENPAGRTAGDDCNLYPSVSVVSTLLSATWIQQVEEQNVTSAVQTFESPYVLHIFGFNPNASVLRHATKLHFLFHSKLKYHPSRIISMPISY